MLIIWEVMIQNLLIYLELCYVAVTSIKDLIMGMSFF